MHLIKYANKGTQIKSHVGQTDQHLDKRSKCGRTPAEYGKSEGCQFKSNWKNFTQESLLSNRKICQDFILPKTFLSIPQLQTT